MLAVTSGEVALEEVWLGDMQLEKVASGRGGSIGGVALEEEVLEELV